MEALLAAGAGNFSAMAIMFRYLEKQGCRWMTSSGSWRERAPHLAGRGDSVRMS